MTLRITARREGEVRVMRIDGRLTREEVRELEAATREGSGPLRVELSGLQSADAVGLDALRRLAAEGVELAGASTYIRLLLEGEGQGR